MNFKKFYKSSTESPVQWGVVLFTGDYNPISREEYHRTSDFVNKFIRSNREKFLEDIDIGLLTSDDSLNEFGTNIKFELTFEERQYITGKLFGLKMFPINFNELFSLAHFDKDKQVNNKINKISTFLKENFNNSNILVVLRPEDSVFVDEMKEISHIFSDNNINLGFVVYTHTPLQKDENFRKIPISGSMIKACCLLDAEKPDPLELKSFVYKYNLQDSIDAIKLLHFKTNNDKYDLVFNYLFPNVKLHNQINDEKVYDSKTLLELIKKMYLSKV